MTASQYYVYTLCLPPLLQKEKVLARKGPSFKTSFGSMLLQIFGPQMQAVCTVSGILSDTCSTYLGHLGQGMSCGQ